MNNNACNTRRAGLLLHPTSLPSKYGIGDLGREAYKFIDYLADCGQHLWQVLPLGPTGYGDSPYQGFSAFAGQTLLIDPDSLLELGLVTEEELAEYPHLPEDHVDYGAVLIAKNTLFAYAFKRFDKLPANDPLYRQYQEFCEDNVEWLPDYALYRSLKKANMQKSWLEWPTDLRITTREDRKELCLKYKESVKYYEFLQFLFFRQWNELKKYANEKGICIIGDIPIFVSLDSADVWANQEQFQLDETGYPTVVAGVPPDYFSATGQLWGNPLYDWDHQKKDGYSWWIQRIKTQLKLVDYIRVDHFRGFDAYWAVPYGEPTAINGKWTDGPKEDLFDTIAKELGDNLPIWAEDLGVITPDVEKLRDKFNFPGMKILQFAYEDPNDNAMMPAHHIPNSICYTGTHDNDTTIGWYESLPADTRRRIRIKMNCGASLLTWAFIKTALQSVANYVIIPLQDLLMIDSSGRMNTPGRASGNWCWRFSWDMFDNTWSEYFTKLTKESDR